MLRGVLSSNRTNLLYEVLFLNELWCSNILAGRKYSKIDILLGLSSNDQRNEIKNQEHIVRACCEYIADIISKYEVVPATDLIKISVCIEEQDIKWINAPLFAEAFEMYSTKFNEILNWIYSPDALHHIFVRLATVYISLASSVVKYTINILALDILFTAILKQASPVSSLPVCVAKYHLLHMPFESQNINPDIQDAVIDFLKYLKHYFEDVALLLQKLEDEAALIDADLKSKLPKIYLQTLSGLLQNKLSLRNKDLVNNLHITPKTAIKYMHNLEMAGFIKGYSVGREKIYVNSRLSFITQE